jgi:hypothetical protein
MIIGKCNKCGETAPIVPVMNPDGLCGKCWSEGKGVKKEKSINEGNIISKFGDFKH